MKTQWNCLLFFLALTTQSIKGLPRQVRDGAAGGPAGLLSELTASEKTVHADFYNGFGDLFDDNDLN